MNIKKASLFIGAIFVLFALASGIFWKSFNLKDLKQADFVLEKEIPLETVSFVVPHHLVAQKLIEEAFQKIVQKNKNAQIERIILVSPNHFNLGKNWVIASEREWKTKEGDLAPDILAIEKIRQLEEVSVEEDSFQKEHGIKNMLPFIAKHFPSAKVVPLMVRDGFPLEKAQKLGGFLAENFSQKTILILSSDFSHELEKNISEFHDQKTIESIKNKNYSRFYDMDTDCSPGLVIISKYCEILNYENFEVIENSNSSEIYKKDFIGENTSYITGFFSKKELKKEKLTVGLMFFGDFMLDRHNRSLADKNGVLWHTQKIRRIFWGQDENIINLEGAVTENESVSVATKENEKNHFVFTFNPKDTETFLRENKIRIVNIGNNHILNFGENGLEETKNNLANFGVKYFGDPKNENSFLSKEINGKKIGFINYNEFSGIGFEKTAQKIREIKEENDFLIVYTHWGREYSLVQNEKQREKARLFIDSGADLIVGSHPHVVQPIEIYKNKAIFYSLGNFVFDQYFSQETKERLALGVLISEKEIKFYMAALYVEGKGQLILADEEIRSKLFERMAENSLVEEEKKEGIRKGKFSIEIN